MKYIEMMLRGLAHIQYKYPVAILILFTLFSGYLFMGIPKVELESDFSVLMPQDIPIAILNSKIRDTFSGQDTIFVLLSLDKNSFSEDTPTDIRNPLVMEYVRQLESTIKKQSVVDDVQSIASVFDGLPALLLFPQEFINAQLKHSPLTSSFVTPDYTKTMLIVNADIGQAEEKILKLNKLIEEEVSTLSTPPGVKITVTGTPQISATIVALLKRDSIVTLLIASGIIILLLVVLQRSFKNALVIFTPIFLGIMWTMGTMGHAGIKLSVVTAGLGAMILGLGVEYGVFILTRYREERENGFGQEEALKRAVPGVGSAIIGSGSTTIIGFLALTFSILPMLALLGLSLALGIFFSIIAAVVVEPVIIILVERFGYWRTNKMQTNLKARIAKQKVMKL